MNMIFEAAGTTTWDVVGKTGQQKEPRNILDPCPYSFRVFLEVFPKRLNSSLDGWHQVTRQHKKDQWALDDVISHTDVLLSC